MTYPTPYTVGWHTSSVGDEDPRGNTTTSLSPPLTAPGDAVRVYGWAPTRQDEVSAVRVVSDIDLFVPPTVSSTPGDVVDLPLDKSLGTFEVVAYPEDWNHGPFGFQPGSIVKLKRVES